MVQSVSFLQQSRKTEYKAKRNSARAFCPIKCITHKHKNKHVFRDRRAEVVLGTFNFESLGLSRRQSKVSLGSVSYAFQQAGYRNEYLHTTQRAEGGLQHPKSNLHLGDKQFVLQNQNKQAWYFLSLKHLVGLLSCVELCILGLLCMCCFRVASKPVKHSYPGTEGKGCQANQ